MSETIFSKILNKEIPAEVVYEDDQCMAFKDVSPQAPTHILLIPRKPIAKLSDATGDDERLLGHLMVTVGKITKDLGTEDFRVVVNNGAGAGQSVFHLHLHILAGRPLTWPPG